MCANQSNTSYPLVSVGIPTYNGAKRISKALNSVFQQDYPNLEIIISDNGSSDETQSVCESYAQVDPRIRYHRQPQNMGLAFNFEYVLQQASGKYFLWLSDDDEMVENVIPRYVDYLEQHPEYILVSGEIDYWEGSTLTDRERNLNFEQASPLIRAIAYYAQVQEGALIYGMMRTQPAKQIPFKSLIGPDWHFMAAIAYLGKIRQLNFISYIKYPGIGISRNFHHYAKIVKEAPIWGYLPYTKMAKDAFLEMAFVSKIYKPTAVPLRWLGGIVSCLALWGHYNLLILPRIGLGKILRTLGIKTPKQRRLEALQKQSVG